ncbi:MAG: hypothetical protein KKA60_12780 [Proteobacteria bacterium]|nr:hypothetical protein [Pseudomonadota bacterium]
MEKRPHLIFTTDVNGTTTPENSFAELVRPLGRNREMARHMAAYTSGERPFSQVLAPMADLARGVDRERLAAYAREMPLFPGAAETLDRLVASESVRARVALSTTGFAGLMTLVNRFRHHGRLLVAASPVLEDLLTPEERACLIRRVSREEDKVEVIRDLTAGADGPVLLFHVGDSLGDFPALEYVARSGGTGLAFCPNPALAHALEGLSAETRRRVAVIRPAHGDPPSWEPLAAVVAERLWTQARVEL